MELRNSAKTCWDSKFLDWGQDLVLEFWSWFLVSDASSIGFGLVFDPWLDWSLGKCIEILHYDISVDLCSCCRIFLPPPFATLYVCEQLYIETAVWIFMKNLPEMYVCTRKSSWKSFTSLSRSRNLLKEFLPLRDREINEFCWEFEKLSVKFDVVLWGLGCVTVKSWLDHSSE